VDCSNNEMHVDVRTTKPLDPIRNDRAGRGDGGRVDKQKKELT